jgi:hypothetical protein
MHPVNEYKYFYVYKTTNLINGKIYIGIHAANTLNNRYLGSGINLKKSIKKNGRDNFKKEILQICATYDEALTEERRIVTREFVQDPNTYNVEVGGLGGKIWNDEARAKMSATKKGSIPWNKSKTVGTFMTEEARQELSRRMSGKGNHMYGIDVANIISPEKNAERLKKISENNRKPKSTVVKYREYAKNRFWIVNENGKIEHCVDENDLRLLSGLYKKGMKWQG